MTKPINKQTKYTFLKIIFHFCIISVLTVSFFACTSAGDTNINTEDPQAAFNIAMRAYNSRDYLQAITDFSFIKVRFSGSQVVDQAQYYLAMSHFNRKEYILSAYEFETLIRNYPTSDFAIQARYNMAMSYYNLSPEYYLDQTYTFIAISEFQNFIELYPNDEKVADARNKIRELRNKLSLKHLRSAELYLKMEDRRAALIYYDYILKDYFETEYADDALLGKIRILVERRRFEEAKEEIKRFEEMFSTSPFLGTVRSIKNTIPI